MNPTEQQSFQKLEILRRTLALLEEQAAKFGDLYVPPYLLIDIEDTRLEISGLEKKLGYQDLIQAPQLKSTPRLHLELVGRRDELDKLDKFLKPDRLVNIWGMAGVGKSSLALAAAQEFDERFTGGQIYIDFADYGRSLNLALETLSRVLGDRVDFSGIEDTAKFEKLLVYLANFDNLLLLLDNADSYRENVIKLSRSPKRRAILVTSRKVFEVEGFTPFEIKPTNLSTSREIFSLYYATPLETPEDKKHFEKIIEYCAGLPLALRIAGALSRKIGLSLLSKELNLKLLELKEEGLTPQQKSVYASFELSYGNISSERAKLFLARLGQFPTEFDSETAARWALIEQKKGGIFGRFGTKKTDSERWYGPLPAEQPLEPGRNSEATKYLLELVELSLISKTEDGPLFTIHNLLKSFSSLKLAEQNASKKPAKPGATVFIEDGLENLLPEVRTREAAFLAKRARENAEAGLYKWAYKLYGAAFKLYKSLNKLEEMARIELERGEAHLWEGNFRSAGYNLKEAQKIYQSQKNLAGEIATLELLVECCNQQKDYQATINYSEELKQLYHRTQNSGGEAELNLQLISLYATTGEFDKAEQVLSDPTDPKNQAKTGWGGQSYFEALYLEKIGRVWKEQEDYQKALAYYLKAHQLFQQGENKAELAACGFALAEIYTKLEQTERASQFSIEATTTLRNRLPFNHSAATNLVEIGKELREKGKYHLAMLFIDRALDIFVALHEEEGQSIALNLKGLVHLDLAEYQQALSNLLQSLKIEQKLFDPNHPYLATTYNNLGLLLNAMGDYTEAKIYHQKALEIQEKVLEPDHPNLATSYNNLGMLLKVMGDYPQAKSYHQKALDIQERVLEADHPDLATSYNNLGTLLNAMGDYTEAKIYHQKALAIWEKVLEAAHPDLAISYNNLGHLLNAMGDYPQAKTYLQKAVASREKVLEHDHPSLATSYNNLGTLLHDMGDYLQAKTYLQKALVILRQKLGDSHPTTRSALRSLEIVEAKMERKRDEGADLTP